jgi:FkbM family methyltransferase
MTFISYSQNNEDVLLWRALGHVKDGFYIDVGASDPVEHSVTKAFYEAGWHGINIEPLPAHIEAFREQRPRDLNLAVAAGGKDGSLTLYDVPEVRGWASPEAAVAELHRAEGHQVAELTVPVRTLASICAEHVQGPIHFLKIDVEGFEGEVLRGMDFTRWRPWVLVIEATLPNSRETNHEAWDALVTGQRYRYAWFDGLNRYYVAEEHPDLLAHFGIQPNVFDDYIPHHLDSAWRQIGKLRSDAAQGWERAADMERNAQTLQARHQESEALRARSEQAAQERYAEYERTAEARRVEYEQAAQARQAEHEQAAQVLRARYDQAAQEADALAHHCEQLRLENHTLNAQLHQSTAWGKDMETRLLAMLNSTSWRVTAPMRFVMRRGPNSMAAIARRKAKGAARRGLRWLTSREALRRAILPMVMRSPRLQSMVARTLSAAKQATADAAAPASTVPPSLRELPQSAREALDQLRRAYAPNQE